MSEEEKRHAHFMNLYNASLGLGASWDEARVQRQLSSGLQGMSHQDMLAQMGPQMRGLSPGQVVESPRPLTWGDMPPGRPQFFTEKEAKAEGMKVVDGVAYPPLPGDDPFHNHCPKCSRLFINNISCPRCGWRMGR